MKLPELIDKTKTTKADSVLVAFEEFRMAMRAFDGINFKHFLATSDATPEEIVNVQQIIRRAKAAAFRASGELSSFGANLDSIQVLFEDAVEGIS